MSSVVAAAAPQDDEGSWLVEIYADGATQPVESAEAALRLLVAEAVRGASASDALRRVA